MQAGQTTPNCPKYLGFGKEKCTIIAATHQEDMQDEIKLVFSQLLSINELK